MFCMIKKYRSGDISYWIVDLKEEDRASINQILEKYLNSGYSSRGQVKPILDELEEILD